MNRTLALLAVILFAVSLIGCTGYPDGPSVSFKNQTDLLSTTWRVRQAIRNGDIDIRDQYEGEFFQFDDNGGFRTLEVGYTVSIPPYTRDTTFNAIAVGEWQYRNDRSQLELLYRIQVYDPYNPGIVYLETFNRLWRIDRLAEGELWLSDDSTQLKMEFFVP
jgi:hypothetical protein